MKFSSLFLLVAHTWGAEVSIDAEGRQASGALSVALSNNCGTDGMLRWVHPTTAEETEMFPLSIGEMKRMETFPTHRFFFYNDNGEKLSEVTIKNGQQALDLCNGESSDTMAPTHTKKARVKPDNDRNEFERFKRQRPVAAKFKNVSGRDVHIYYMQGEEMVFNGMITKDGTSTINSYDGHRFRFTSTTDKTDTVADFKVSPNQKMYLVVKEDADLSLLPALVKEEIEFSQKYKEENGIFWNSFYPRGPPQYHMWEAKEIGQKHAVTTPHAQYLCDPRENTACSVEESTTFNLTVISTHPKVFQIDNFLSDLEVEHIIELASPKIKRSTTGNGLSSFESTTRTSSNTWVARKTDSITDNLYRRVADLVKMPQDIIEDYKAAESIQVVHYNLGQKYDAHHDWGVSDVPNSRYITLLMYLSDMESPSAGGETAFPLAQMPDGSEGTKVHPGKGSAIMFYNLLEDGNADDLTLHAALPVKEGEKWLANFWIWDPFMKTN